MGWLPEDQIADIHIIRQDLARAKAAAEADPGSAEKMAALAEVLARRARAIRMVARETESTVPHLAGMFRCTKSVVRAALEATEEES